MTHKGPCQVAARLDALQLVNDLPTGWRQRPGPHQSRGTEGSGEH